MADELIANGSLPAGTVGIVAVLRRAGDRKVWSVPLSGWVAYDAGDIADYAVRLTETPVGSDYWLGSTPNGAYGRVNVAYHATASAFTFTTSDIVIGGEPLSIPGPGSSPTPDTVSQSIITLKEVREAIKVDANAERQLQGLLNAGVALWEFLTRRLWSWREGYVETLETDGPKLWVKLYPIQTVSVVKRSRCDLSMTEELSPTTYYVNGPAGRVELSSSGYDDWAASVYDLTITGGYTSATCPVDVKQAVLTQIHFMSRRWDSQSIIVNSLAYEKGSTSFMTADLHPMFKMFADARGRDV